MHQGGDQSGTLYRALQKDAVFTRPGRDVHSDHLSITAQNNLNFNTSEALKPRKIYRANYKVWFSAALFFFLSSNLFLAVSAITSPAGYRIIIYYSFIL